MKFIAYRNGFEWKFYLTKFDKYGFRNFDRISYSAKGLKDGISTIYLSVFLFILTLGFVIWPGVFRYKSKVIPHRFIGTKQMYESERYHAPTNYRESKVFFAGFVYYVIFAFIMKAFLNLVGASVYNDFIYVTFYMALVTIIPMFATEGYDFYIKGKLGWYAALTIMIIAMLAILIFNSLTYTLVITFISVIIVLLVMLWRWIM